MCMRKKKGKDCEKGGRMHRDINRRSSCQMKETMSPLNHTRYHPNQVPSTLHLMVSESPVASSSDGQERRHSRTVVDGLDAGAGARQGRGRRLNWTIAWRCSSRQVLRNGHHDGGSRAMNPAGASRSCGCSGCGCRGCRRSHSSRDMHREGLDDSRTRLLHSWRG